MPNSLTNPTEADLAHYKEAITSTNGIPGMLPFMPAELLEQGGKIFGRIQDHAMAQGSKQFSSGGHQFVIISTAGGMRDKDGQTLALGLHTGHFELNALKEAAAKEMLLLGAIPYSVDVSDPCDGRTQGTLGMMDSLPYRNDAAIVMGRLARSHPTSKGVLGIATCDKGLPAMMMALAGMHDKPTIVVPGGAMLAVKDAKEDTGSIQSIGVRFARGEADLEYAQKEAAHTCGSPGGGCQFLGTAATAQVVGEALGLSLPHSALIPSGLSIWLDMGKESAQALMVMLNKGITTKDILTDDAIHNAMVLHAAFGGSTNLLLHVPAIAHAAGLHMPTRADWERINRNTPRLVDVLPNSKHPTVRAYMAGGVPEVMLHLRDLGLLKLNCWTVTGKTLAENLHEWEHSQRRRILRERLLELDGVNPDEVIYPPAKAKAKGLTSTITFPDGNIAPEGSVIKSTALDPAVVDADGVYRKTGRAKVFTSEPAAIAAIKENSIKDGDVLVLIGCGPKGTGMEETYQLTSALKYLKDGNKIPLLTDARFSGVSTGACIGHIGPEALAGGPIGKIKNGDIIQIEVDRNNLTGKINFIGTDNQHLLSAEEGRQELSKRPSAKEIHPSLAPNADLPDETMLWAAMQDVGGGTWGGCVYDEKAITRCLEFGAAVQRAMGDKKITPEEMEAMVTAAFNNR